MPAEDNNTLLTLAPILLTGLGVEERLSKRAFSFPIAPRTRQSTALGAIQSVFGGGCGLFGVDKDGQAESPANNQTIKH